MKYLYAMSIKGIQEFIFSSNELKDIEGASEIVKNINEQFEKNYSNNCEILLNAAGNIKAIFKNKKELEKVLNKFYKEVLNMGYGLLVTQAVLKIKGNFPTKEEFSKIENILHSKRNKPNIALDRYLSIMELSPKSARPTFSYKNNEPFDKAKNQKHNAYYNKRKNIESEKDLEKLANKKGKIAVIHADGNSLGQIVSGLGKDIKKFSEELNNATEKSFKDAINKLFSDEIKYREVVLGGDDMSVIMDADYALEFTNEFLKNFEENTKNLTGLENSNKNNLTACAGIAITNKKYPFYYAIELAESLCGLAKKASKKIDENNPPSSLMFYNLQSGIVDFEEIKENTLKIKDINLIYGPYYLNKNPKIDDLIKLINLLKTPDSPVSKLREWLKFLEIDKNAANIYLDRIYQMAQSKWNKLLEFEEVLKNFDESLSLKNLINKDNKKTPVYEILEIIANTTKDKK